MKKYTIILFAIIGLAGCKNFLEPSSPNEYVPKTAEHIEEMLIGNAYTLTGDGALFQLHGVFDDDVSTTFEEGYSFETGPLGDENAQEPIALAYYSWDPDMYYIAADYNNSYVCNIWPSYYGKILGANAAIDYIDKVSGTQDEKNSVKGQAHALRAFYYFHLVNLFGEPYTYDKTAAGVPLKLESALNESYTSRNTVEEVYQQILKDLDAAEKAYLALPESVQFKRNYHTSLPMVQLLRSRVYLYMNDLPNTAEYARKVIEDWGFALYDIRNFSPTAQLPYPHYVTYDNPEVIWPFGGAHAMMLHPSVVVSNGISNTRHFLIVSPELRESYSDADMRKKYYYLVDAASRGNMIPAIPNYRPIGKGMPDGYETLNSNYYAFSMRLSEAYLNLAEAIALTNPTEALDLMNELRRMRIETDGFTEVTGLTGQALLDFVREERRRELCFEGHRWFDLRRYGMPSITRVWRQNGETVTTFTLQKEDVRYTLPIHYQEIESNPALTKNRSQL